jgi:hypothetical protein
MSTLGERDFDEASRRFSVAPCEHYDGLRHVHAFDASLAYREVTGWAVEGAGLERTQQSAELAL